MESADIRKPRWPAPLKWALFALAGGFLAWRIVILGMAEQHATELDDPATALGWFAGHADARLQSGLREQKDADAALAHLQAAIAANPTEGRSYAALGRLLENRGDDERARLAMETASRLSPQRSDVQMAVATYWMRQGDLERALVHWNTVLRHRPGLRAQVFPELLQLAGDPANHAAFLPLLGQPVPWWPAFFIHAASKAPDVNTARVLFNLQQGGPNAPTPDMLRAWLARLQKEGEWLEAWFVWLNSLTKDQIGKMGYLYNGSFEAPISNLGFDWIHHKHPAVSLDTAATYDTSGERALRVSFRGLRAQFQNLHQYLMLPPGKYHLQGRVRPDNLQAEQGMQWALYCLGSREPIAVSERFRGSQQWTRFRTEIIIPPEGCPVQTLRLELAGTIRLDFDASGTIWFDNLTIEQVRPTNLDSRE
jgi:tetratricopeptide (TPR) repeat protein